MTRKKFKKWYKFRAFQKEGKPWEIGHEARGAPFKVLTDRGGYLEAVDSDLEYRDFPLGMWDIVEV